MTGLGVVLTGVPLALWVAWTPIGFIVVAGLGLVSGALLLLLNDPGSSGSGRDPESGRGSMAALPDRFVEEIHRIFPLTYHHSRKEAERFRSAMERLRRMMH